ncbi:MAG: hypothetical protein ACR2IF_18570 [Terriglobales bacterium]
MAIVALVASAGWAQPQNGRAVAGMQPRQAAQHGVENTPTGPMTLTGCVSSDRGLLTLVQKDLGQPFILMGDERGMAGKDGREVRVVARQMPPPGAEGTQSMPRLQVERMEVVADNCANNLPAAAPAAGAPSAGQPAHAIETAPYGAPGADTTTTGPVGPGTGEHVNGRTEGAPSPGSGDPRNIAPSPPPAPANPPQNGDANQSRTKGKKKKKTSDTTPH